MRIAPLFPAPFLLPPPLSQSPASAPIMNQYALMAGTLIFGLLSVVLGRSRRRLSNSCASISLSCTIRYRILYRVPVSSLLLQPLLITSAVAYPQPRTVQGRSYIYVEAFKEAHVREVTCPLTS